MGTDPEVAMVGRSRTVPAQPERARTQEQREGSTRQNPTSSIEGIALELQKQAGNRLAAELLRQGQARLELGPVGDPYEVEADQMASEVVHRLANGANLLPHEGDPAAVVMRKAVSGASGTEEVGPEAERAITSARGSGRPLEPTVREEMENAFGGVDFSRVRLHSGSGATALNRQLSAEAFTVGSDIFLGGRLPGRDRDGRSLLAHELTHTIQQGAAQRKVQRLWGKKKTKEQPKPTVSPFIAQQVSNAIVQSDAMKNAEKLRDEGKEEEALQILETFWQGSIVVKTETGHQRLIQLAQFKPLMFTPAERRVIKNRKWRVATAIKAMWDEAVRKGEVQDPGAGKDEKDYSKTAGTVGDTMDKIGTANTLGGYGAKIGDKVELEEAAELSKLTKKTTTLSSPIQDVVPTPTTAVPKPDLGQEISEGISKKWSSELDTHSISDSSDSNYEASKYANKSEWAEGIIGIIGQTISLVSSVTQTIALALDKKATKADVAAQIQDNLAQAASTAGTISQAVENIQGSELTTNMFHWVPGLSVFSNGFAAIGSAVKLVQRSYRVFKINKARAKATAKEEEDLQLAVERVWVRAAQQVEQDAFSTAKSLANTGLAIAEVATAGGFGIPKLAQAVLSTVSFIHNFGHTVADSVRAAKTKDARKNYFGAKLAGSAEKLIRHDPWEAAHSIVSRAAEGDANAIDILGAYDIVIPGLTGPKEKRDKPKKGTKSSGERTFEYDAGEVEAYNAAVDKLANALQVSDQPQTLWDKVKDKVESVTKMPGQVRDRYRQAARIRDVRNEQGYGGVKNRGAGWAIKQTIFAGDSGVKKLSEKTAFLINTSFAEHEKGTFGPKAKKSFNVDSEQLREDLLARIQPEEILRAKSKEAKDLQNRKPIDIKFDPALQPTWDKASKMSFGALESIISGGKVKSKLNDDQWQVMVIVFADRFAREANVPVGAGHKP